MIDYHIWALIQQAAQQVQAAMPSSGPVTAFHEPLSAKITTSAVIVYVIELAKRSKWVPWLTAHTKYINRAAAMLAAGASAIGVHSTFDHSAGTLVITGLTLTTVLSGVWAWLQQYVLQEVIYQGAVNKQPPPVVP